MDTHWLKLVPWTRNSVSWGPTNTHLPLTEGVGDILKLTPDQLAFIEVLRKRKVAHSSKAAYEREREQDLEGFLARKRTEKSAWAAQNAEKVAQQHAKTVAKIKSEKRFHCDICSRSLASSNALDKHLGTEEHKENLRISRGGSRRLPSQNALRSRDSVSKTLAARRFVCSVCNFNSPGQAKLDIHKNTKGHKKKIAKLATS